MRISDWSSDVCSSDLAAAVGLVGAEVQSANGDRAAGHAQHQIAIVAELRFFVGQFGAVQEQEFGAVQARSEERRVGKECVVRVDLGGRRIIKKKNNSTHTSKERSQQKK